TNAIARPDSQTFRIISERNIFDPNRSPRVSRSDQPAPRPRRTESFTLIGTMSSDQGTFAFFDSNSSQYRKTAKPQETIAGYKIAEIGHDSVKLAAGSNQTFNLPIGNQMRRQDDGPWSLGGREEPAASSPPATTSTNSEPSGQSTNSSSGDNAISDVMKR